MTLTDSDFISDFGFCKAPPLADFIRDFGFCKSFSSTGSVLIFDGRSSYSILILSLALLRVFFGEKYSEVLTGFVARVYTKYQQFDKQLINS